MGFSRKDVEILVKQTLSTASKGLTFEEIRSYLELKRVYVDGLELRKIIADMVRDNVLCKEVSPNRRKLLIKLCK
ncbi:MAG: hypothetical protein QW775_05940 [Ignisphaera sp.]|uniref:Uncharacterized protein n=1 Tax=Ignisphaera aggregans TaxID=334771 RepID=A0A7C4JKE8_9CREN